MSLGGSEDKAKSLKQPLLDSNAMSDIPRSSQEPTKIDYLTGRIYASNAPKIFLETITARTALLIIITTYTVFIIGFSIDLYLTYQSFNSSNFQIPALPCANTDRTITSQNHIWGCASGNVWNSTVTHLENVLSVKLSVQHDNITNVLADANTTFNVIYNVDIWACYSEGGCNQNFESNDHYTSNGGIWQHVLQQSDETITINVAKDVKGNDQGTGIQSLLVPYTFQNQESIPTNGKVKSYFIQVEFVDSPYDLFVPTADTQDYILYFFDVVSRPLVMSVNALTIILMAVTIAVLVSYCIVLSKQKAILSEQKWVIAYFVLLILFQNPVYCVIVWYTTSPPIVAAFSSYVVGYIAQSGLFILWLLFADSIRRKTHSKRYFYGPKVFIGAVIFAVGMVVLSFQFPGLDPTQYTRRNAVQAVANWTHQLKVDFITFTIMYLVLIWVWTIMWFLRIFVTGRHLKKLPYMSTRYIQLSYRFFSLQATLVTIYYVFQYGVVIYFISANSSGSDDNLTNMTDNINTLFRQQTQLFGKTLFLTVYALILAFLFLPSNLLDNKGISASLAATYVITEAEHREVVKTRKRTIKSMRDNLINQVTLVNQLVNAKADVFCVDMALNMRNVSFQAYYDPKSTPTASGFEGEMDLDKVGYELLDAHYNRDHEVFCFICREKTTKRLVVCFRGTASKKQMEDNLNYGQRPIDFKNLELASLDQLDGLSFKKDENGLLDDDMESVSDADELEERNDEEAAMERKSSWRQRKGSYDEQSGSHPHRGSEDTSHHTVGDTMKETAENVTWGFKKVVSGAVHTTGKVVDATTGIVVSAAAITPGLKQYVTPCVHSGFWEAYVHVRPYVHAKLRQYLVENPTTVIFTGHSLGGALATFASLDVSLHTIPRVNAYLKHKERQSHEYRNVEKERLPNLLSMMRTIGRRQPTPGHPRSHSMDEKETHSPFTSPRPSEQTIESQQTQHVRAKSMKLDSNDAQREYRSKPKFVKKIKVFMYNYGSPRVGNLSFAQMYDKEVRRAYRVVVDGDLVTGLPPGYTHIGTEILIDSVGAGSIIIDPSFVERWLRTHTKSSVAVHSLLVYRKGLLGIKFSAEFMKQRAVDFAKNQQNLDPLRLALTLRQSILVAQVNDDDPYSDPLNPLSGSTATAKTIEDFRDTFIGEKVRSIELPNSKDSSKSSVELKADDSSEGVEDTKSAPMAIPQTPPRGPGFPEYVPGSSPIRSLGLATSPPSATVNDYTGVNSTRPTIVGPHDEGAQQQAADGEALADARHYAHDVEIMNAMLGQIKELKRGGPVDWLKKNTLTRMLSRKPKVGQLETQSHEEIEDKNFADIYSGEHK